MTRLCRGCGIADWMPCVCDIDAEVSEFDGALERARRVAIQHAIAGDADRLIRGDDTLAHLGDHERLTRVASATGALATDVAYGSDPDLRVALTRLGAEVQCWLEALARETAAR